MASHAFIISYLLAPHKSAAQALGGEWGVGFRGQEYSNISGVRVAFSGVKFSWNGGSWVSVSPPSGDSVWQSSFPGCKQLSFCGYYWLNNAWFGGFIDWWPITSGNRNSRPLTNAGGQFEAAKKAGIKKFAFCFTDWNNAPNHPLTAKTNFYEINF